MMSTKARDDDDHHLGARAMLAALLWRCPLLQSAEQRRGGPEGTLEEGLAGAVDRTGDAVTGPAFI
jgi:hypothetical protein